MLPEQQDELEFLMKLNAIPVTGICDGIRCENPATQWFGRTNQASCGNLECIANLQYEYDNIAVTSWDDDNW